VGSNPSTGSKAVSTLAAFSFFPNPEKGETKN